MATLSHLSLWLGTAKHVWQWRLTLRPLGPWILPAALLQDSLGISSPPWYTPRPEGTAVQVTEMSGKYPILTGAPGRTQPPGQTWCSCDQPHSGLAQLLRAIWVPRLSTESPEWAQRSKGTRKPNLLFVLLWDSTGASACVCLQLEARPWEMQQPWQPEHDVPCQAPAGLCTHPYCSPTHSATIYPWIN